jgi:hypothetical protein
MSVNDNVRANVELLEARAREAALQEVDRATGIDQKATALITAGLVLVAAGVAFATAIGSAHAGNGARLLWAPLLVAALVLSLAALGLATAAVRPRVFRIVLHMNVLNKWASTLRLRCRVTDGSPRLDLCQPTKPHQLHPPRAWSQPSRRVRRRLTLPWAALPLRT